MTRHYATGDKQLYNNNNLVNVNDYLKVSTLSGDITITVTYISPTGKFSVR